MATPKRSKGKKGPQTAAGRARALANLQPAKPGEVRNAKGRPSAGATLREWVNVLADKGLTEAQLRQVARDKAAPWPKRAAAERILRTLEAGDVADMEPLLNGSMTPAELRAAGVNTEVIKKIKTKTRTLYKGDEAEGVEVEREVELHDRAGVDFDRIADRTEGKPGQTVDLTSGGEAIRLLPIRLDGDKPL